MSSYSRWKAEREAARARYDAEIAHSKARYAEEQAAHARAAAQHAEIVGQAEQEFQWKKEKAMVDAKDIEFVDPKDFRVPSSVSARNGRKYHADGSFSIQTGGYSDDRTFYLPNGVIRVCSGDDLLREELPDGRVREYEGGDIKYEREANGDYRIYEKDKAGHSRKKMNRLVEEGNNQGWQKRYPRQGEEISASGYYKVVEYGYYDSYTLVEEGNFKTGEYQKYNSKHHLVEEGVRESGWLDENKYTSWRTNFDYRGDKIKSATRYDQNGRISTKIIRGRLGDTHLPKFNQTRPCNFSYRKEIESGDFVKVIYNQTSDGSDIYLSEVISSGKSYEYDELGRITKDSGDNHYTYHGDTNVVATAEVSNSYITQSAKYDTNGKILEYTENYITKKFDDEGRVIQRGKSDDNCERYQYYGNGEDKELVQIIKKGKVVELHHYDEKGKEDTKAYLKAKERREALRKIVAKKIDKRDSKNPEAKKERVIKNKGLTKLSVAAKTILPRKKKSQTNE